MAIPFLAVEQLKTIQQMDEAQMIFPRPVYIIDASKGISSFVRMKTRNSRENTLMAQKKMDVNWKRRKILENSLNHLLLSK